jgi:hypothetical protein
MLQKKQMVGIPGPLPKAVEKNCRGNALKVTSGKQWYRVALKDEVALFVQWRGGLPFVSL